MRRRRAACTPTRFWRRRSSAGWCRRAQTLPLSEIHQLIFRPGFSTAEKITEISGRGVGMDVVRRNIEALRGRIEIQTEPGKGTTFSIKLPLTLAIVEGLLLRVGEERFVMPTFSIRESLRPKRERVHTVQGVPRMIQVRDSLLPLINLAKVFNIPDAIAGSVRGDGRRHRRRRAVRGGAGGSARGQAGSGDQVARSGVRRSCAAWRAARFSATAASD